MPSIGYILVHDPIEKAVFGWLEAGPPTSLATVHPAKHQRFVDVGETSAEIARHSEIVEQIRQRQRGGMLHYVTFDAGNVALGDVGDARLSRKNSLPFSSVRHAIGVSNDFHAVRCNIARHLIRETNTAVELLTLRQKPMVLTEQGIPSFVAQFKIGYEIRIDVIAKMRGKQRDFFCNVV